MECFKLLSVHFILLLSSYIGFFKFVFLFLFFTVWLHDKISFVLCNNWIEGVLKVGPQKDRKVNFALLSRIFLHGLQSTSEFLTRFKNRDNLSSWKHKMHDHAVPSESSYYNLFSKMRWLPWTIWWTTRFESDIPLIRIESAKS